MRVAVVVCVVVVGSIWLDGCKQDNTTTTSCPDCAPGCCLPDGRCQAGNLQSACGKDGQQCQICPATTTCVNRSCLPIKACDSSCAGCCDGVRCVEFAQQDQRLCGSAGARCQHCGNGRCESGVCQAAPPNDGGPGTDGSVGCNEQLCPSGCCQQGVCLLSADQSGAACGIKGASCLPCPAPGRCDDGVCVIEGQCNNDSCAGCCSSSACLLFGQQDEGSCGVGGVACKACETVQTCQQGSCSAPCGPSSCNGCCEGGKCLAVSDQSDGACGLGGGDCQGCSGGATCNGGTCGVSTCDAWSCSDGCCDGGDCKDPPSAMSCGIGGVQCKKCDAAEQCEQGDCVAYWQVKADSASVKKRDGGWDDNLPIALPPPDTYLICTIAGSGKTGQTKIVYDQYSVDFNDEVIMEDSAANIEAGVSCDAMDDDETAVPEYIGSCTFTTITSGTNTATACTNYLNSITLKFEPK